MLIAARWLIIENTQAMSSRQLKKLQQRQEATAQQARESDEDDDLSSAQPARNAFAGLLDSDSEDDSEAAARTAQEPPSACAAALEPARYSAASACASSAVSHRRKHKNTNKAEAEPDEAELLAAVVAERAACPDTAADGAVAEEDPLKLNMGHLDATKELSRTFGRNTLRKIAAAERAERGAGRGPGVAGAHQGGRRAAKPVFVRPRDTWPPLRSGLGMELQRSEAGVSWFSFTQSALYVQSEMELQVCVQSADPNSLQRLLRTYPFQLDALLLLSDYLGRTAQHELAAELVERAVYACEGALHPMCKPWLGTARLSWAEPANRPFFRALGRHMLNVARRGCPRTALEIGRLLVGLDPAADPTHALLHLDHFALRAAAAAAAPREAEWVLRLPRAYPSHGLGLYPNYALSAAVALRWLGRAAEAERQLRRALLLFPAALPLLAREALPEHAGARRVADEWAAELGAAAGLDAAGATLRTLLALYAARHAAHWREAAERDWLLEQATALLAALRRGDAATLAMRDDCAAVRASEYGGAPAAHDEFAEADPADFTPELPAQLPADEDEPWQPGGGAAGAARRRPPRLPGRLVVPPEEWVYLDARTNPLVQFFLSLVPWAMPPPR